MFHFQQLLLEIKKKNLDFRKFSLNKGKNFKSLENPFIKKKNHIKSIKEKMSIKSIFSIMSSQKKIRK